MSILRRVFSLSAVATVTAAVLLVPTAPVGAAGVPVGPAGDAFYQPPAPLPGSAPGDPIWYRATPAPIATVSGASAYHVLYRSKNATGADIAVSSTVFVPLLPTLGTRPIVALAPGTQGIGDKCAPSKAFANGTEYDQLYVSELLNKGWAVAVTDYEGLGTPGDHTYVIGQSEGRAMLDSVRAATRVPAIGLRAGGKVGLIGYSQGGGAAAWAGELQPSYAPDLNLVGISAGGVPADLDAVGKALDGSAGFGLLLFAAVGLDTAYPELNLESYLNDAGRKEFADREKCVSDFAPYIGKRISDYTTRSPLTQPDWQARMAENKLGSRVPGAPIFLYHASGDALVPFGQADALRREYCAKGAAVKWGVHLGEHVTAFASGRADAVAYLADRFAGKAAPRSC
ncbi:Triacylglycerol lipase precursor [Alloactinosynnema sp. L-07]|uniref:lipase family protein n=1 Tax=Alloactinosynnema sp. L-07 TaxID=1653480 RepID=UPI00065EF354|nr:lipase family protein [Alloactinosynnema sp. L-07]CRK57472.1 Triacylglycerol lipase precursor [Alloactinosynnema sp. L-07]